MRMATRRFTLSCLPDSDNLDETLPKQIRSITMAPRRSFDLGSFENPKHGAQLSYISEPGASHARNPNINNDYYSSSEFSDYFNNINDQRYGHKQSTLCEIKSVVTDNELCAHKFVESKTNKTLINYIGIGHDPALQTKSEVRAIRKSKSHNSNVCITECIGLTLDRFRSTLESQPQRLHLTFHGEYDASCDKSIVKFDRVPILPQLLTSSDTFLYRNRTIKYYRDYIAAIARLFEEEILRFIHGQPRNKNSGEPFAKYTVIPTQGIFEHSQKLRALFKNIAERRFRCPYVHYRNRKFIAIWYGTWRQDDEANTNRQICSEIPNLWLLEDFHLSALCTNRQIDAILRQIKTRYKRIVAANGAMMNKLQIYQQYCWRIMTLAIQQVIPSQVWQWLNTNAAIGGDNAIGGELYSVFEKTFELIVSPKKVVEKSKRKRTATEQGIIEQRIRRILEEILRGIRQDSIASQGLRYVSPWLSAPLLNYKIVRFVNDASIACVRTKVIAKFQRKYRAEYEIIFNQLHCASLPSHLLCGYVPINEQKSYEINGNDEISQIIAAKLRSRKQCRIKLLLLLGCHSYALAQIFSQYIECIICVHPHTEIDDTICVKFSQYFYQQLAKYDTNNKYIVKKAFDSAMDKLKKSYRNDTACQFHKNTASKLLRKSDIDNELMIVRIDSEKHYELKQYVRRHLNCAKLDAQRRRKRFELQLEEMSTDSSDDDDIDNEHEWEWCENKSSPCFSYTMITCSNSKIKYRIEEILKDKKYAETLEINQKLQLKKICHRKGLLSETEDDVNYVNLRWDVTNVPQCSCTLNIPHRIEDELVLLINGKHIDREFELEEEKKSPRMTMLKRSKSIPNIAYGPYNIADSDDECTSTSTSSTSANCIQTSLSDRDSNNSATCSNDR